MPLITADIDISIYCETCGAGICNNATVRANGVTLDIEPCERCLENARDEGYNEGLEAGRKENEYPRTQIIQ